MQQTVLSNKVALVTGSARRIGAEIAKTLHAAGMNIVLHYHRSELEAKALCAELNAIRAQSAALVQGDLGDENAPARMVAQAFAVWQRLDTLINNASKFYRTKVGEVTTANWDDLFNSNLRAPFFLAQAAAPHLTQTEGSIVNITDIHAEFPLGDYSVYCLTKSGLLMLTRSLAKELAPAVRVNAVAPGPILWPEGENTLTEAEKLSIIGYTTLKRPGTAMDIAAAVLFLVKDAHYITGQVIDVDGGRKSVG